MTHKLFFATLLALLFYSTIAFTSPQVAAPADPVEQIPQRTTKSVPGVPQAKTKAKITPLPIKTPEPLWKTPTQFQCIHQCDVNGKKTKAVIEVPIKEVNFPEAFIKTVVSEACPENQADLCQCQHVYDVASKKTTENIQWLLTWLQNACENKPKPQVPVAKAPEAPKPEPPKPAPQQNIIGTVLRQMADAKPPAPTNPEPKAPEPKPEAPKPAAPKAPEEPKPEPPKPAAPTKAPEEPKPEPPKAAPKPEPKPVPPKAAPKAPETPKPVPKPAPPKVAPKPVPPKAAPKPTKPAPKPAPKPTKPTKTKLPAKPKPKPKPKLPRKGGAPKPKPKINFGKLFSKKSNVKVVGAAGFRKRVKFLRRKFGKFKGRKGSRFLFRHTRKSGRKSSTPKNSKAVRLPPKHRFNTLSVEASELPQNVLVVETFGVEEFSF